jgi:uncharacterized glyoxalase superfamily protein PhnB/ketosteroid isomerase-like protein
MADARPQSEPTHNRSAPPGVIVPVLEYPDVRAAADWLCAAFGFAERLRIGSHRVQLTFGGASVVVHEAPAGAPRPVGQSVLVRVADARAHHARAAGHGATILRPPTDHAYGERQYVAEDPAGHRWTFTQSVADADPTAWGGELLPADELGSPPTTTDDASTVAIQTQILRAAYAALNRGDVAGFLRDFDADVLRTEPPGVPPAPTFRGLAAFADHAAQARATWAEGACEPQQIRTPAPGRLIVTARVRVRLKDQTTWLEGTVHDAFAFRGGKVVEFHTFLDEGKAMGWARGSDVAARDVE